MIKIGALFLLGMVFTAFLVSNTEGTAQRITLYNSTGCSTTGRNTNVNYTSTTTIGAPWDNATLSFKFVGMWRLNATDGRTIVAITPTSAVNNGQCINKADALRGLNVTSYKLTWAERIGTADMTTNQIVLYPQQNFGGASKSAGGNATGLYIQAQSYVHFGRAAWLVYSTANFTETPTCLKHATNGNGDTYTHMLATTFRAVAVQMILNGTCPNGATYPGPGPGPNPSTTTTKKPGGGGGGGSASNVANILLTSFLLFSAMAFTAKN